MFEHLPVITDESLEVMVEKELPYFTELLRRCTEADDQAIDLDAKLDAQIWLLGCPMRAIKIAVKRASPLPF